MQPDRNQITDSLKVDPTRLYSVTVYTVVYLLSLLSTMAFNNLVKSLIMSLRITGFFLSIICQV